MGIFHLQLLLYSLQKKFINTRTNPVGNFIGNYRILVCFFKDLHIL